MQNVYLERLRTDEKEGTLGILLIDYIVPFMTLEPPWRDNAPWDGDYERVSCIPIGSYTCQRIPDHPRFGDTFEVLNVPERDGILFHVGNYRMDSMGCILLGERWGQGMLLDSRTAMSRFRSAVAKMNQFRLLIRGDHATFRYPTTKDRGS